MNTETTTRFTAVSALCLAAFSLGLTLTLIGCQREAGEELEAERRRAAVGATESVTAKPAAQLPSALGPKELPATTLPVQELSEAPASAKGAGTSAAAQGPQIAAPSDPAGIGVKRLIVTHGIENREPVATDAIRTSDAQVVAFIEAQNGSDDPSNLVVTFEHASGEKVGFVKLEVPKQQTRWRTWARSSNVKKPGEWVAVVRTAEGTELARQGFEVQG